MGAQAAGMSLADLCDRVLTVGHRPTVAGLSYSGESPGPEPMISETMRSRSSARAELDDHLAALLAHLDLHAGRELLREDLLDLAHARCSRSWASPSRPSGRPSEPRGSDAPAPRSRGPRGPQRPRGARGSSAPRRRRARAAPVRARPGSSPSVSSCWTSRGSCSRRIVFAMCDRDTPTRSASSSCLRPRSSRSCPEGLGQLDRTEVLAMDVLDQGLAQDVRVVGIAHHDRDRRQSRLLGRPRRRSPATSSYADRRPCARRSAGGCPTSRIEAASEASASSANMGPGLLRVRGDRVDRHLEQPARELPRLGRARDQRRQPSTESTSLRHHSPPLRNSRHRRFGGSSSSSSVAPMSATAGCGSASAPPLDAGGPAGSEGVT